MTKDEAIKMAKAKLECLERSTSGLWENCNNDCENCNLNYDQGNMGEQKEWLKFAIKAMEQGPIYFPPCVDCNTKMNEIREAYDKLKNQAPCEDAVSRQAVLDELRTCFDTHSIYDENNGENYIIYEDAVDMMEKLPPVTPTRKVGKWIKVTDTEFGIGYKCSECGRFILTESVDGRKLKDYPYCHCGADMRGGE